MKLPTNPVLRRELKERMRTRRTGVVLTVYLAVLSLLLYGLYTHAQHQVGQIDPLATATLGRNMFETLLFAVLLLVCFLVPGYTAGAIVGERERQTLIPLQLTLLTPGSIVIGKLMASLAFLFLLLVATAPLFAVSFFFGGVTLGQMLLGVGMVAVTGVVLAAVSLAVSSVARRVQAATVAAYGLALLLTVGTFVFYGFEAVVSPTPAPHNKAVLVFNPIVATADVVAGESGSTGQSSPFTSIRNLLRGTSGNFASSASGFTSAPGKVITRNGVIVGGFAQAPVPNFGGPGGSKLPYGGISLLSFVLLSLGSLLVAVRRTTTPGRSDRA